MTSKRRKTDVAALPAFNMWHWLIAMLWAITIPLTTQLNLLPASILAVTSASLMFVPIVYRYFKTEHKYYWRTLLLIVLSFNAWVVPVIVEASTGVAILPLWLYLIMVHLGYIFLAVGISYLQTFSLSHLFHWFIPLFAYTVGVYFVRVLFPDIPQAAAQNMYRIITISLVLLSLHAVVVEHRGGMIGRFQIGVFIVWAILDFTGFFGAAAYQYGSLQTWSNLHIRLVIAAALTIITLISLSSLFNDTTHQTDRTPIKNSNLNFGIATDLTFTFLPLFVLLNSTGLTLGPRLMYATTCLICGSYALWTYRNISATLTVANSQLSQLAYTDHLTKVYNRTGLQERIEDLPFEQVTVFFIDLDAFKDVNDKWGHQAGDTLLFNVATTLTNVLPKSAVLARYGGDEFVALFHTLSAPEEHALKHHIKTAIQGLSMSTQVPTTATIGVATGSKQDNIIHLIEQADLQMYQQKNLPSASM